MSLKDKIDSDFICSYKAHEEEKVSVLRLIKSAIKNNEISLKHNLSDDEVIKIMRKEVKQRQDAIIEYAKGDREDLAAKEKSEITIIEAYLPTQMDRNELETIVEKTIEELGASTPSDMGKVIGAVVAKTGGQADGSVISQIVRDKINKK